MSVFQGLLMCSGGAKTFSLDCRHHIEICCSREVLGRYCLDVKEIPVILQAQRGIKQILHRTHSERWKLSFKRRCRRWELDAPARAGIPGWQVLGYNWRNHDVLHSRIDQT